MLGLRRVINPNKVKVRTLTDQEVRHFVEIQERGAISSDVILYLITTCTGLTKEIIDNRVLMGDYIKILEKVKQENITWFEKDGRDIRKQYFERIEQEASEYRKPDVRVTQEWADKKIRARVGERSSRSGQENEGEGSQNVESSNGQECPICFLKGEHDPACPLS
jgi:hypothetical protein